MTSSIERLPAGLARRIALAAQGFADPRPAGGVGTRQLRRNAERLGVVQIDSVNVLSRSHYMPALQPARARIRGRRWTRCPTDGTTLFEYWAHEASFLPVRLQPQLRWRMAAAEQHAWGNMVRLQRERPGYVGEVLDRVREGGPAQGQPAAGTPARPARARCGTGTPARSRWSGCSSPARSPPGPGPPASSGSTTSPSGSCRRRCCGRRRRSAADAIRELVRTAARALGVATETDLRDYFRLPVADVRAGDRELVEAGELLPVAGRRLGPAGLAGPGGPPARAGSGPGRC